MRSVLSTLRSSCQPLSSVPTSSPPSTCTSSKNTLQEESVLVPSFSIGVKLSPSRATSTMNIDRPSVRRLTSCDLVVRATTSIFCASSTPVIQILRPFRRQPLPSRVAKVFISKLFEPASGSVSAMQQLISPAMILGNSSDFIASEPKRAIETPPKIGLIMKSWPTVEPPPQAARVSRITPCSCLPKAAPPYCSGSATPHSPPPHTARQKSFGKLFLASSSRQ